MAREAFWVAMLDAAFPQHSQLIEEIGAKDGIDDAILQISMLTGQSATTLRDSLLNIVASVMIEGATDVRGVLRQVSRTDRRTIVWVAAQGAREVLPFIPAKINPPGRALTAIEGWVQGTVFPITVKKYSNQTCKLWPQYHASPQMYATHAACIASRMPLSPWANLETELQSVYTNARMAWHDTDQGVDASEEKIRIYNARQVNTIRHAIMTLPVYKKPRQPLDKTW